MIKEDYVSFEVAKLLKDKGFNEPCYACYIDKEVSHYDYNATNFELIDDIISAPTLQMAIKWLREGNRVHIVAEPCLGEENESNLSFNRWFWTILKEDGEYKPIRQIDEFSTYEEACEAAIKYCLENLI